MAVNVTIREGLKTDMPAVLALIHELAVYEKAPHEVIVTAADMEEYGFGNEPYFKLFVACEHEKIIGISLFFIRYSTWKGPLLYLEDLVVSDEYRGQGIGHLLFERTMQYAHEKNLAGMAWQVLDWNEPAIRFYDKYKATYSSEWLNGRLSKDQIASFFNSTK